MQCKLEGAFTRAMAVAEWRAVLEIVALACYIFDNQSEECANLSYGI